MKRRYSVTNNNSMREDLRAYSFFVGYASIFNLRDKQNDIMLPGAFRSSLQGFERNLTLLWEHNPGLVIGHARVKEDNIGLYVRGTILLSAAALKTSRTMIAVNAIRYMSIGYSALKFQHLGKTRYIKAALLHEVSIVSKPANFAAKIYHHKRSEAKAD